MSENGEGSARSSSGVAPTYAELLALPELLSLQRLHAEPKVHDELLFVIVHQAHELWFKQMLAELAEAIRYIDARHWAGACTTLDRLCSIVGLLTRHLDVLDTMSHEDFQRFRAVLGTASGMQSAVAVCELGVGRPGIVHGDGVEDMDISAELPKP